MKSVLKTLAVLGVVALAGAAYAGTILVDNVPISVVGLGEPNGPGNYNITTFKGYAADNSGTLDTASTNGAGVIDGFWTSDPDKAGTPIGASDPASIGGFLMGLKNDYGFFRSDFDLDFSGKFWGGKLIGSSLPFGGPGAPVFISVAPPGGPNPTGKYSFVDPTKVGPAAYVGSSLSFESYYVGGKFQFYVDNGQTTKFNLPNNALQPEGAPYEDDFNTETGVITKPGKPLSGGLLRKAEEDALGVPSKVWLEGDLTGDSVSGIGPNVMIVTTVLSLDSAVLPHNILMSVGTGGGLSPVTITGGDAAPYFLNAAAGANFISPSIRFDFQAIPYPIVKAIAPAGPVSDVTELNGGILYDKMDYRDSPDFRGFAATGVPEASSILFLAPPLFGIIGYRLRSFRKRS